MLTFKKKVGEPLLWLCALVVIMNIFSYLITKKIDIEMLVIDILYALTLLFQVIRFFNLKKRGIIQKQVRYTIEKRREGRRIKRYLYAYIKDEKNMEYKVNYKEPIKDFDNIPDKGFVDVIVDSNNFKNYFILLETINKK